MSAGVSFRSLRTFLKVECEERATTPGGRLGACVQQSRTCYLEMAPMVPQILCSWSFQFRGHGEIAVACTAALAATLLLGVRAAHVFGEALPRKDVRSRLPATGEGA